MENSTIAILLATYNGAQYLGEQIDSILAQTNRQWHLYIHDDGSTDGTAAILHRYADSHPDRITLMDYPPQGGAFANFMSLLEKTETDYYMFCDQDDLWHPDKIEKSLSAMTAREQTAKGRPIVVHADLRVVDENGQVLASSFWQQAGMHPEMFQTFEQRITNVVTGCTMLFNQRAKAAALRKRPAGKPLHDEWVTIRACAEGGMVVPLAEPLIDYRQHTDNTLGAEACYHRKTVGYYLSHLRHIWNENAENYRVLRSAGYGSPLVYLINKVRNIFVYHFKY